MDRGLTAGHPMFLIATMSPHERALSRMSPEELAVRRKLGEALMEFTTKIMEAGQPGEDGETIDYDEPVRRHLTEKYREAVEEAAAAGIETPLTWHALGVWTEDGRERIGYFSRALDCIESGRDRELQEPGPQMDWSHVHTQAECLYEIGRVHAHEGEAAVARSFLLRALPLAQEADRLRGPAGVTHEDGLEGRIAALLVQLPDED